MKTRLLVGMAALAAAVVAGGWLMGDDKKPDDPKVTGHLPPHYKKLGLSDAQVQNIYKIQTSYKDKIDALQQQIDDLKKAEHTDIENVLTDAQKTALKALQTGDPPDPVPPPKDKPPTPSSDHGQAADPTDAGQGQADVPRRLPSRTRAPTPTTDK